MIGFTIGLIVFAVLAFICIMFWLVILMIPCGMAWEAGKWIFTTKKRVITFFATAISLLPILLILNAMEMPTTKPISYDNNNIPAALKTADEVGAPAWSNPTVKEQEDRRIKREERAKAWHENRAIHRKHGLGGLVPRF